MDKQEYKLKADEIKSLIAKRDFFGAVKIADEIDWKRVRSVAMLCTVSDLYKVNRRYNESKELLLMAYERNSNGRMIVYSLCELCIKMGEVVQAIEYYKEFVQLAPMDNGKYVLQYKLYVAQDVSLEERIAVLEELKKRDYREKWGYELAYLYHRIGLSTKCVEECDELIIWFSDGRYVKKAMELKMLHQPLTAAQEASYNSFIGKNAELPKVQPVEEKPIEEQIEVQPMNVGKYDTMNLQKALAESMKEVLSPVVSEPVKNEMQKPEGMGEVTSQIMAPMYKSTDNMKEIYFEDKTGEMPAAPIQVEDKENVSKEAIPAMAEAKVVVKEDLSEVIDEKVVSELEASEIQEMPNQVGKVEETEKQTVALNTVQVAGEPVMEKASEIVQEPAVEETPKIVQDSVVEEIPEIVKDSVVEEEPEIVQEPVVEEEPKIVKDSVVEEEPEIVQDSVVEEGVQKFVADEQNLKPVPQDGIREKQEARKIEISSRGTIYEVPDDATKEIPSIREIMSRPLVEKTVEFEQSFVKASYAASEIPSAMADMLSQEYDGQISLVMDESAKIEKQITGQMNIEDVLIEWEKTKKEYEEKRTAERTRKVLEQTGSMFSEFEAKIRDGILEQLEKEAELADEDELEKEEFNKISASELVPKDDSVELDIEAILLAEMEQEGENHTAEEEVVTLDFAGEEESAEEVSLESIEESSEVSIEETTAEEVVDIQKEQEKQEDYKEETLKKVRQVQEELRELNEEEKNLFAPFIQTKGARRRFMNALDQISLAAYTGNVIVTGEADSDTLKLAKNIMKNIQMTDSNFSGVIAKVSGASLNSKSIEGTIAKLNNGGLIIEKASGMNSQAVSKLLKSLDQEKTGIVVIMEDSKKAIKRMMAAYPTISSFFNAYVEIEELNNDVLASYGRKYAAHLEYAIDDLGMLALQTLIEDRQTSDHIVTVAEVREMVDDAIYNANRKTIGHFFDIIFGRRYDEEDMIILRERDFM